MYYKMVNSWKLTLTFTSSLNGYGTQENAKEKREVKKIKQTRVSLLVQLEHLMTRSRENCMKATGRKTTEIILKYHQWNITILNIIYVL